MPGVLIDQGWVSIAQGRRAYGRSPALVVPSLALEVMPGLMIVVALRPHESTLVAARRYIIPLAPIEVYGQLSAPMNFGYRCTLVDAAAVLNDYGVPVPQGQLALRLSDLARYSVAAGGIPWWEYVSWPAQRPLLDQAIERASREAGRPVTAHTQLGLSFDEAAAAIAGGHPVILNVFRTPTGTPNHSLLAYGFDARAGKALLYAIDPNSQDSYWIGPETHWSWTITSTYIMPVRAGA